MSQIELRNCTVSRECEINFRERGPRRPNIFFPRQKHAAHISYKYKTLSLLKDHIVAVDQRDEFGIFHAWPAIQCHSNAFCTLRIENLFHDPLILNAVGELSCAQGQKARPKRREGKITAVEKIGAGAPKNLLLRSECLVALQNDNYI